MIREEWLFKQQATWVAYFLQIQNQILHVILRAFPNPKRVFFVRPRWSGGYELSRNISLDIHV